MLDHANRRDGVELVSAQVAVIGQPELDQVLEPRLADALATQLDLLLGERDPEHLDPIVLGRVHGEAAPPAAYVEHPLTRLEGELPTHQVQLGLLGLGQGLSAALKIRTAVGHRRIQKQSEELVAGVVVVADRAAVAPGGMPLAPQTQLGRRRTGRFDQARRPDHSHTQPGHLTRRERRRLEGVDDLQCRLDVVDVDQAEYVGPAQAQLPRGANHVSECLRRFDLEGGPTVLRGRHGAPIPEANGERALREGSCQFAP